MDLRNPENQFEFPENKRNGRDRAAGREPIRSTSEAKYVRPFYGRGAFQRWEVVPSRERAVAGESTKLSTDQDFLTFIQEVARKPNRPNFPAPISAAAVAETGSASATSLVRASGPIVLFKQIVDDWQFSAMEAATLLGFDDPSIIVELYSGKTSLRQRDAKDRLKAILAIAADLDGLYRDEAVIRDWLILPQTLFGGKTAKELLAEGSMENLLRVKQYVEFISGR